MLRLIEMPSIDEWIPRGSLFSNGATVEVIVAGKLWILVVHMLDICESCPMQVLPRGFCLHLGDTLRSLLRLVRAKTCCAIYVAAGYRDGHGFFTST